jgi:hypothetical protein
MLSKKGSIILVLMAIVMLFGLGQLASAIEVNVMPDSPSFPKASYAWVGRNLPIWGNVTGGTPPYNYEWDINDDGTPEYSGAVSNPKHIVVGHTYATATTYFARLTVTDSASDSDSDIVRIRVEPSMNIDTQVEAAIQDGLRYLYLNQSGSGDWGYYQVGSTGMAVLAFEKKGYHASGSHIFADTVQRGLDYLFSRSFSIVIDAASDAHHGNLAGATIYRPNTRSHECYETPIAMMAIVASGTPNEIITVGAYAGQTYRYLIEETADFCAWAQNPNGGWRYHANYGSSDNSVSQWPAIGLEAAETDWGIGTAAFVKNLLLTSWIPYSQHSSGRFGYTSSGGGGQIAMTAAGICELAYCDQPKSNTRVQNALNYLDSHWSYENYYAMYGLAKGCRISLPDEITLIGTRDWQDEYNQYLVSAQSYSLNSGSRWHYGSWELGTAFAVLILSPGITTLVPVADAGPDQDMPPDTDIPFDGSGSYHQDPTKSIVAWEWDVDDSDGVSFSPPDLTGSEPTLVGGYPEIGSDYSVTVTLRVTDNVGDTDTDTMVVNITSGNVPPIADAGGPYYGEVNELITFDGSASYDPNEGPPLNDHIVSWDWDMDGDGQYDDASGETIQWSWPTPHSGVIGLKVTDSFGASGTASAEYTTVAVSELWIVEYRWSTQTSPPYTMTTNPDGSTTLDAWMEVRIENRGNGDAFNVTATLVDVPDYVTILDGDVTFGDVPAQSDDWSDDDFGIRVICRGPTPDDTVWWDIEWDDAGGHHHIMQNVPMFGP